MHYLDEQVLTKVEGSSLDEVDVERGRVIHREENN